MPLMRLMPRRGIRPGPAMSARRAPQARQRALGGGESHGKGAIAAINSGRLRLPAPAAYLAPAADPRRVGGPDSDLLVDLAVGAEPVGVRGCFPGAEAAGCGEAR